MTKYTSFVVFMLLTFHYADVSAQCCAPGNPVSGSEHTGIVAPNTIRLITFLRHSFSDTYYDISEPAQLQNSKAGYDYIGEVLSYGFAKRFSAEAELGYYVDKYQDTEIIGKLVTHGFNNAVISVKYAAINYKGFEVTVGTGVKIPLSHKQFIDKIGLPYPQEIHPSTRAFGFAGQLYISKAFSPKWKSVLTGRYETNGYNKEGYRFGDAFISSLFISRTFSRDWVATLQFRNEYRKQDLQDNIKYLFTGGNIAFISPQLSYTFKSRLTTAISADLPVLRNYNGIQLGPKYAVGISIVKDICLIKK
ncbi:MAG TPA: hypothetical protein VK212_05925 [Lentimicrobium sp.]|nr:hypothetical protein [Lentimicrobium sp.]